MITFAILALLSMSTTYPQPSVSELNTIPEKYHGKTVTVTGWMVLGEEERFVVSRKKGYTKWKKGATCLSVINANELNAREDELNGRKVRLTGVVRANADKDGSVRLDMCSATGLDLENGVLDGKIEIIE